MEKFVMQNPLHNPLHIVARSIGIVDKHTKSLCAVCGQSPFEIVGRIRPTLGPSFSNQSMLARPGVDAVCIGCKEILGGRPGRVPPPLRMVSIEVDIYTGQMQYLKQVDWWERISRPLERAVVLSWAISRKKQHVLFAGISEGSNFHVGSDDAALKWRHDDAVLEALLRARNVGASKGNILSGIYRPKLLAAHGAVLKDVECVLGAWRGRPAFDILVHALPSEISNPVEEHRMALSKYDEQAVGLLSHIAWGSQMRIDDGLRFWGSKGKGFFLSRIHRFARLPLPDLTSRLIAECRVGPTSAAHVYREVQSIDIDDMTQISLAIQQRGAGLHALAYDQMAQMRKKSKSKSSDNSTQSLFGDAQ